MKKLLALMCIALVSLSGLSAQNLRDNEFQRAGLAYERQAKDALEAGEYAKSAEYAELAAEQFRLSREYVSNRLLVIKAANMITLAKQAVARAERSSQATEYAATITRGKVLLREAETAYSAQKWENARIRAEEVIALMNTIPAPEPVAVREGALPLPRWYIVGPWEKTFDCYWNIAKKPEVYNNPVLWGKLYEANRANMRNPDNPNLIHPGMRLEIPPLRGEKREGTFTPGAVYEPLPK